MLKRIGRYEIEAELGRGGFGQVFRAYDPAVNRRVAVKMLGSISEPELRARFRNEASTAGKLQHPNIVVIYDFGEHDGLPFLVMELVEGRDLERVIAHREALELSDRLDIMRQVAMGLEHAHSKGVLHRDIKPANVMVHSDGTAKILDFGIALVTHSTGPRVTPQGSMIGTVAYMAPEQFHGEGADQLTDIFSYGVTCYRLLAGTHPFEGPDFGALMYNIAHGKPKPIRLADCSVSDAVEQALGKMLAKDRELRYHNFREVQFDLEPLIRELRKARIVALVGSARGRMALSDWEGALEVVRQASATDVGNLEVRELQIELQKKIRAEAIKPRVEELLAQGLQNLGSREFTRAAEAVEAALHLASTHPELVTLKAKIEAAQADATAAEALTRQASTARDAGDLIAAEGLVSKGLARDPAHAGAQVLAAAIRDQIRSRSREATLKRGLSEARKLLVLEYLDEAGAELVALQADDFDSPEIAELLARIDQERASKDRAARLIVGRNQIREFIKAQDFHQAALMLTPLLAEFPNDRDLRDMKTYVDHEFKAERYSLALKKTQESVERCLDRTDHTGALMVVRSASAQHPESKELRALEQRLLRLQSERARQHAVEKGIREAGDLLAVDRFEECLALLKSLTGGNEEEEAVATHGA